MNANLVHTDDVSWFADPVHWDGELLAGIVNPWRRGENVAYKPSGWRKENRPGSIDVDPNRALVIEGMGATRKTLRRVATYSIWVDTEPDIARARVVQRDLANGENGGSIESVTEFGFISQACRRRNMVVRVQVSMVIDCIIISQRNEKSEVRSWILAS